MFSSSQRTQSEIVLWRSRFENRSLGGYSYNQGRKRRGKIFIFLIWLLRWPFWTDELIIFANHNSVLSMIFLYKSAHSARRHSNSLNLLHFFNFITNIFTCLRPIARQNLLESSQIFSLVLTTEGRTWD